MIPKLYESNETKFDTNGIGPLTDAVECFVEEERNGKFELKLKYPITGQHYDRIKGRCLITAKPAGNRDPQPFRIYDISRPMKGIVTVKAQHISYDLSGIIANPFETQSVTVALQKLQTNTVPSNPFTFWTDKSTSGKFKTEIPASVRSLLGGSRGSILDCYGGEWEFDKYLVRLWAARGQDRGVSIRYGKNLTDVKQDENCANVRTGIYPYWHGQEGELVTLPEHSIDAPGTYDFSSIKTVDFSGDWQEKPTVEQLRARAQRYVRDNNIGVPSVSLKVKFAQLEQSEEYKGLSLLEQVNLCDTVTVVFPALGVNATAKCNKTVYNVLLDRMERVELGDARPSITDTILDTQADFGDISSLLSGKIPTPDVIKSIAMQVTAQILGAQGGAVRLLDTNEDGFPDTLYIADDPDPAKAVKVWRWNYEGWGASKTGYNGTFTLAASLDQGLYGDFITAGTITANLLKAGTIMDQAGKSYWNLDTGEAKMEFTDLTIKGKTPQAMADQAQQQAEATAQSRLDAYKTVVSGLTDTLQSQIDGSITTWFNSEVPTASNYPASSWTTTEEKNRHLGDLYYIINNTEQGGKCYRWLVTYGYYGDTYSWQLVEDSDIAKAIEEASRAANLADKKMQVFSATPVPPYDLGDLWAQSDGDLKICTYARQEGESYSQYDWAKAVDYVNSAVAQQIASAEAQQLLNAYKTVVNGLVSDLQTQVDSKISTWYNTAVPTAYNFPASNWTSDDLKQQHEGDLYYVTGSSADAGKCYRWKSSTDYYGGKTYSWERLEDPGITKALADASKAADLVDKKMQVFGSQPVPPYGIGDLWADPKGDLKICNHARTEAEYYYQYDWVRAFDYANTTDVENISSRVSADMINAQTQRNIFDKLTDNGKVQGIYLQGNQLYINASYIGAGIISDPSNNFVLNLTTGEVQMKKGFIELGNRLKISADTIDFHDPTYHCKMAWNPDYHELAFDMDMESRISIGNKTSTANPNAVMTIKATEYDYRYPGEINMLGKTRFTGPVFVGNWNTYGQDVNVYLQDGRKLVFNSGILVDVQ